MSLLDRYDTIWLLKMFYLSLKKGILLGMIVFFWIIQPVSASELLTVSRSEEQAYCPVYYDKQFCSTDASKDTCAKGIEIVVETPTPTITSTPSPVLSSFENISVKDTTEKEQTIDTEQKEKPASLNTDLIFEMINSHRTDLGLIPYAKEDNLCVLAAERGPELYDEIFVNGNIHGGLYERNPPWWITENMKYGASEEAVFNWWLSSPIHRKAIEGDFIYSCGVCYGNSCAQLFTSYTPK